MKKKLTTVCDEFLISNDFNQQNNLNVIFNLIQYRERMITLCCY